MEPIDADPGEAIVVDLVNVGTTNADLTPLCQQAVDLHVNIRYLDDPARGFADVDPQRLTAACDRADGAVVFHYLPSVSSSGTGQKRWMERTRLYADPGTVVAVSYRNQATVFTTLGISLSGYLVNVDPFAP